MTGVKQFKNQLKYDPTWDHIAIALKTGQDVAVSRVPIQLVSFLSTVRNKVIIGEAPGTFVGDFQVVDVYTDLYNKTHKSSSSHLRKRDESESVPNEDSQGWKADAHKNLPGLVELYKRFPSAEWYLMIDDDTYVLKANLAHFVAKLDSSLPYYFGAATVFIGCDGITEFGQGPEFAHGGSGILLSRSAMKLLINASDKCIQKYKDCWAGDVRVALCMRDVGVRVTNSHVFNKDPPNQRFSFGNPCLLPVTFHHLLPKQIQTMYNIENQIERNWKNRGLFYVTLGDIYQGLDIPVKELEGDTDRKGWDLNKNGTPMDSPESCRTLCQRTSKCRSFVYDGSHCWIKEAIPSSEIVKGSTSGVIREHYICS